MLSGPPGAAVMLASKASPRSMGQTLVLQWPCPTTGVVVVVVDVDVVRLGKPPDWPSTWRLKNSLPVVSTSSKPPSEESL